ncbi:putative helicase MAGATAMA 3 [Macleaya cordata]|uniref:Putative helicase MAGATAMA 3 n=1 Tax=Macleaya cordata TaxID=56857 RepID=A0A200R980_MACCD|nr:putative helicase MAGATAMA 3 [Macleaya cordata]
MAKKTPTRRELLDRWRGIEEDDDVVCSDPTKQRQKEEWFSDTFNFLICLPKETHIWCGSWDLMGPLLETFYNYFKDKRDDSPLKLLWKRISQEMRQCTQCVCQHHQAQEMYTSEYELSSIGPLLKVLRSLDEERVTQHLKEINAKIAQGDYDSELHNAEVVSVMFEVLMFPVLLDDQSLVNEFQIFIEAVDNSHELTLAGHQQYPGVYALLFLKSRQARSIGLRLAGHIGKLRRATDLEPLQPLLKKCIGHLETEVLPSTMETSRPRLQLERITVWLGIKALLGFLEPPAFEEGILERYPILLSIILNHVSDDSLEFTYAVNCLRMLFEMLGCKLWLRTSLSPSVMRNTLLGQCFHTRNEKSHKEIFDLFQPFLQASLQDGEHEKQRRHFLYFLLHQVNMSSNFSILMRKKACQIALRIIHRGYKMNPPCPPFECAHMWGPSLICSLKDSSLHSSLRQPAFDLIHTILVSDAAALISSLLNCHSSSIDIGVSADFNDEEDEILFSHDVEEKDTSCWSDFSAQGRLTSQECREWMCIPMLWFDVLVEVQPSVLPISFSKAVVWALSRFSLVEPENGMEMALSVRDWLPTYSEKISASFGWEVPTGSDDGGDGKESKNSIKVSKMCLPLIKIFKRCAAHYIVQMEQGELWKQWTWEPSMAESLILLLLDPNDNVRQVDRLILEHVSKTQGLACGLQFLCSSGTSLFAIYLGLIHALKLVQLENVLSNFHYLHHFLFVLRKLLKDAASSPEKKPGNPIDNSNISTFSSQGGFLRQPVFNASPVDILEPSFTVDLKSWESFSRLLSESMWPSMKKCLVEGKGYINDKTSQMTCIRLLELLPIVFERMSLSFDKLSGTKISVRDAVDIKWLHDLIDWRKSSLAVIARYWKQSAISLLHLLKGSCHGNSAKIIGSIETLISCDNVEIDELKEQVSRLSVSLPSDTSCSIAATTLKPGRPIFGGAFESKYSALAKEERSPFEDVDVEVLDSVPLDENKGRDKVIVLSDDEAETNISVDATVSSCSKPSSCQMDDKTLAFAAEKSMLQDDRGRKAVSAISTSKNLLADLQLKDVAKGTGLTSQKHDSDAFRGKGPPASLAQSKRRDDTRKETYKCVNDVVPSKAKHVPLHRSPSDLTFSSKTLGQSRSSATSSIKDLETRDIVLKDLVRDNNVDPWEKALKSARAMRTSGKKDIETRPTVLKKLIIDDDDDPWEKAVKAASRPQCSLTKPSACIPKRQVIQLNMPGENKSGYSRRMDAGVKRLKPPKLDDWYRPILEIDYFSTVGLSSGNEDESTTMAKLTEVPVCFESPDHYVDIFRPLVLEEFKAQLRTSFTETSSSEEMCCDSISVLSLDRVDDFHLVRCVPGDGESTESRGCSENDLVLLTKQPLQNSSHDIHLVGKVERREKDNKRRSTILVIRLHLQNGSKRFNKAKRLLIERSKWYISRIMSITSQLREFQALSSLNDIPVLPIILKPTSHSHGTIESRKSELGKLSEPLQQVLKSSFNDSQLQAISAAIGNHDSRRDFELSLIQGPPGTGKTRTILAIVSGLLALPSQRKTDASKNSNLIPSSTSCTNPRAKISQSAAISRAWQDAAFARQLNEGEDNSKSMENFGRGRVLICAQSNAAVDELVSRISNEGLYGSDGKMYKPYLVRVGNPRTVHPCSLPFFIDTLVDQRLAEEKMKESDAKNDLNGDSSMALRANLEKLVDRIRFYEAKRAKLRDGNSEPRSLSEDGAPKEDGDPKEDDVQEISDAVVGAKLQKLYEQKRQICRDLGAAQSREKKASEEIRALKNKLRKSILREAKIVVTTLSGCGGDLYGVCSESLSNYKFGNSSEHTLFDAVVIDEAAQALEPATLIPLQLLKSNGTKCIMVGDPKQLPATVLSQVASKYLYECSMFERLQRAGHPVIMLTEQYRMHPEICQFPSLHFYDNKLLNGNQMASKLAPFHEDKYLGPYVFFDITEGQECQGKNSGSLSLCNESEADAAVEVLRFFKKRYATEFVGGRIGIISPYKSQVLLLRSRFSSAFGPSATADMEFNTVDGYQGREVDILILSTVRASDPSSAAPGINTSSIGFVADVRRMNVALTRAKLSLWIFGNAMTLRRNQNWGALVKNAEKRNLIISIARPYWSVFKKPFSDSKKNPRLASSDSHSKHPKLHEIVKDTTKCVDQIRSNGKEASECSTGNVNDVSRRHKSKTRVDGKNDMQENGNVPSEVVAQRDSSRRLKDVKHPMTAERVKHSQAKGKEIARKEVEKSRSEAKPALVQQDTDTGNKTLNQMESEISLPSTEGTNQEREVNDKGRESNMADTPKDLIAKRKRQRDAVDALLSSALIPSKKAESKSKLRPVKRPLSPTAAARGAGIRPPKPKKAPSTSTASSQDGAAVSTRIKMHQPQNTKDSSSSTTDLDEEWKSFKDLV